MVKSKVKRTSDQSFWKFIKWFWITIFSGLFLIFLVFMLASWGAFGEMPTFERLENPQTNLATEIISSDGVTLGKYYLDDNRTDVSFTTLPDHLVDALVATEDARYYNHSGIDVRGTLRAITFLGKRGGASTISQQLAKQLFHRREDASTLQKLTQKVKEWVIAIRLEKQYTKEEIIAMYFNIYDFGNNADGIRSAARIYFSKEPHQLDIKESAMLVGMFKNSSLYNPRPHRNPEGTTNRRNVVLRQMEKYGYISEELKDSLQKEPLGLRYSPESHNAGIATYFRMHLQKFLRDWIKDNPKLDGSEYNIYLDGLKVYTTIDSRLQENAEKAVSMHMARLQKEFFHQNTPQRNTTAPFLDIEKEDIDRIMERAMKNSARWKSMKRQGKSEKEIRASFKEKTGMTVFSWDTETNEKDTVMTPLDSIRYYKFFLRASLMSMEPQTGHVKAWVGGVNYKHFQYDQVIQGARQAGSTFKPFVYAAAIDQLRLSPCYKLPDTRYCIEAGKYGNPEPWCPKNSTGEYSGEERTLKNALANSTNSITARLIDLIGPKPVTTIARNLGVKSPIDEVPSIALGTPDLTLYEMVGAYGTFANQGVYVKPVIVTRIEDKNGTVLYEYTPETRDVLSEEVAYAMVNLLEGVTQGGSGVRLRTAGHDQWKPEYGEIITGYPYEFKNPIAGKTGTTQNQSDGWFMGMVPNLVTGVWVGGEDRSTHFRTITYGQGASMALPIWGLYMKSNYAMEGLNVSDQPFIEPEEMSIEIDCSKLVDTEASNSDFNDSIDDMEDIDF